MCLYVYVCVTNEIAEAFCVYVCVCDPPTVARDSAASYRFAQFLSL